MHHLQYLYWFCIALMLWLAYLYTDLHYKFLVRILLIFALSSFNTIIYSFNKLLSLVPCTMLLLSYIKPTWYYLMTHNITIVNSIQFNEIINCYPCALETSSYTCGVTHIKSSNYSNCVPVDPDMILLIAKVYLSIIATRALALSRNIFKFISNHISRHCVSASQ